MGRRLISMFALCVCVMLVRAQEVSRTGFATTPVDSQSQFLVSFERQLHTFNGLADLRVIVDSGPWAVEARQRLRSRQFQSQQALRQDEYQGGFDIKRSFLPDWSFVVREQSAVIAGPTSIDLGELSQHRVLGGALYGDPATASIEAITGWEWNRQQGRRDQGPAYALTAGVSNLTWEEIGLRGLGSWRSADLGDREPSDGVLELHARRNFGEFADYTLSASYHSQRRDLPTLNTGTVIGGPAGPPGLFRRDEDEMSVRNSLWMVISPELRATADAGWNDRRVERSISIVSSSSLPLPTVIRQLKFDASGRLVWEPQRSWIYEATMGFSQGEESHDVRDMGGIEGASLDEQRRQARRRSNQSQRVYAVVRSAVALDDVTDLQVSLSSNILRYDTPDTLNTDDRDELLLTGGVEVGRRWSRWFSTSIAVDASVDHLVYLSRFQSANNATIRSIRLSPLVLWRSSGGFRNALRAEVAASYTVYDFEDVVGGIHSYSYRQAMWSDSLSAPIAKNLWLEFTGSLRLFERGLLQWEEFRERPERSFKELAWWPRLVLRPWSGIGWAIGFRSFRQERTVIRSGVWEYDGAIGSSGPTVDVWGSWLSGISAVLHGWRETQRSEARVLDTISNLSIQVIAPL